ncbi:hypothetical protein PHYBOEH_007455 [Phytophthora boehmeriae]|uniref:EF-hand domain-containing protein n=1 Tax=Phytophthora boehmeriae TaxID=109152 RepID=A0A8T1X216_9STRA|nr:hypothetical protein PHYBOEH_007455 [Phytophthora boehmeriae]
MSTAKKLPQRSQAVALRLPARSVTRTPQIVVAGAVLSTSVSLLLRDSALCQEVLMAPANGPSGGDDPKKKDTDPVERIIDTVLTNCGELTMAGGLGFCSGYAAKQVGKAAALAVGFIFIMAQAAAYNGYIDIKWNKVQKDVIAKVDPNGDGTINGEDIKLWYRKLLKIMKTNLPSSAGFSSGFALGIYYS